jgi:hypothetical protein
MSAHLTVYSMAIAAERPLVLRAAEQERLAAHVDAASGRRPGRLLRHLGSALRLFLRSGNSAQRWTTTGARGCLVVEQPAG